MHSVSLRWRVIICVAVIQFLVLLVVSGILLGNAKSAIATEIAASRQLARKFAIAAVGSLLRGNDPETAVSFLPDQLQQPRHVRIQVLDATGEPLRPAVMPAGRHDEAIVVPPEWFARLIQPPPETTSIPIAVGGRAYGQIVLTTEPSDEIAEVWEDFRDLLLIEFIAYFLLLGVLHLAVERALAPLSRMADAFETLEAGDYTARLDPIEMPELRRLGRRFNLLAAALDKAIEERRSLSHRIISVQDSERRNISMELHDEFGPCLFGIKVEANAIAKAACGLPPEIGPRLEQSARSILSIADHMHENNRLLLSRLRPMELGQLPLREVLNGMIKRFVGQSPDVEWEVALEIEDGEYDETIELTIYRVIQESVTNALRHSEPGHIAISLEAANALVVDGAIRRFIRLTITDDGRGLSPETRAGTGLRGMRERVEGLGGRFEFSSGPAKGTMVEALIPFPVKPSDGEQRSSAEDRTR